MGQPDAAHVSNSHVKRQNLTVRMQSRRYTRLTNAFSKNVEFHLYATALFFTHYNFWRPQTTLTKAHPHHYPTTPAMAAALTNRVWTVRDIVALMHPAISACDSCHLPCVRYRTNFHPSTSPRRTVPDREEQDQAAVAVKTILVVEDNAEVRAMVARALREEGYTVFEAEDGEAAWVILAGAASVHMLVTDIRVPRLDGIQLSQRLTASGKHLPLLFISGYDHDPLDVPGPLLSKPFGPSELVTEVRRIMPTAR